MYIIFNKDGSVKESQLNDYINQYSDGVNTIDIAIEGSSFDNYTGSVSYTFSNGDTATDSGTPINYIQTSSGVYTGWRFTLHSAYTQYEGELKATFIGITNSSNPVTLFSYPVTMTVNATSTARQVELTWEQFKSLEQAQADYQLQYSSTNVRGYASYDKAKEDLANLAVGQKVLANTKSLLGIPASELYEVIGDDDGNKGLINSTIGYKGLSNYYVWKFDSGTSETQSIYTGFVSRFYDTDGNARVLFGTDQVTDGYGFFANVLDASGNYSGAISLGAKTYKFAYDSLVDVFSSDGNTTAIKSPMGSASVELANGDATIKATNTTLKANKLILKSTDDYEWVTFNGIAATFSADVNLNGATGITYVFLRGGEITATPSFDYSIANKSYVDKTAEAQATEKANALQVTLQAEIDAINASQNFVATFATHQDLVNIDMSKLDYSDCVLILKDEDHNDQSTVYRYKGGSGGVLDMFEFVGELGDYYTKHEIDKKVSALNASITSAKTECKAYADTEVGKAKDALRYFYLDEEGYLCLDYDKITA